MVTLYRDRDVVITQSGGTFNVVGGSGDTAIIDGEKVTSIDKWGNTTIVDGEKVTNIDRRGVTSSFGTVNVVDGVILAGNFTLGATPQASVRKVRENEIA